MFVQGCVKSMVYVAISQTTHQPLFPPFITFKVFAFPHSLVFLALSCLILLMFYLLNHTASSDRTSGTPPPPAQRDSKESQAPVGPGGAAEPGTGSPDFQSRSPLWVLRGRGTALLGEAADVTPEKQDLNLSETSDILQWRLDKQTS